MLKPIILVALLSSIAPSFAGVYDELEFGDDRKTVTSKLHDSQIVTGASSDSIFGNVGLNGIFKCNQKLADLSYSLYFGWEKDGLSQITLRSDHLAQNEYYTDIQTAWKEAVKLLDTVYDSPKLQNNYPSQFKHNQDGIIFSHTWEVDESTVVMLGTGKVEDHYFLAIRFAKP